MNDKKQYRLPAEWEPQSGVQLTWPHRNTDWAPILDDVLTVYQQIAREISRRERLLVVAPEGCAPGMVYVTCPTNDTWARDHGFITLIPHPRTLPYKGGESGGRPPLGGEDSAGGTHPQQKEDILLDFCFNGWGEKFPADLDNAINRRLYDVGALHGEYVDHLDFVLEGGSIESDGKGTIFTTSQCLLAPHRNQSLTRDEIEQRLKDYLCADRVLWIDHGNLAGDDTDGHIDTLVRICPDDALLYIGCDDPSDEHYDDLRLMEEQLRTFRTIDGRPYRLMKLPMPRPIYDGDDRLPATYANFLVINGAVLVPTYAQPDLDAEAMRIIGQAFPDRDIVGIDCRPLIRQHGSLHCCTMQFPEGVLG
ncbi:MAG: agmatine deiminase family protein [Prevotella sp.]|nr:agmatine deiminase family protein [Prevotella sp.]